MRIRAWKSDSEPVHSRLLPLGSTLRHLLALTSGCLAVAGWAPLAWWPVAVLSFAALFMLIRNSVGPVSAGTLGWLFGLGLHTTGHGWVYTVMTQRVAMDPASAILASGLLWGGMAAFTSIPCVAYAVLRRYSQKVERSPTIGANLFASLMTVGEIVRAVAFDRFSSLSFGYSLIDTWLGGMAPLVGSYGLGWLGFWLVAFATDAIAHVPRIAMRTLLYRTIPVICIAVTGLLAGQIGWTVPRDEPLVFRLIQPNTTQDRKFDSILRSLITKQMLDQLTAQSADIVVAPETAFPLYWHELPSTVLTTLHERSRQLDSDLIFGIATTGRQGRGHNSMIHIQAGAVKVSQYDKIHLFPFGEYQPSGLRWLGPRFSVPLQNLSPGADKQEPFKIFRRGHIFNIGTLLCHENMLSDEARKWALQADILINPGNLGWFDGSLATAQNLQIARMRSLEVGRPMLRVANTGDTALISAAGVVMQQLPPDETASMQGRVRGETGLTPYVIYGDWPVYLMCALGLVMAFLRPLRSLHGKNKS